MGVTNDESGWIKACSINKEITHPYYPLRAVPDPVTIIAETFLTPIYNKARGNFRSFAFIKRFLYQ